MPISHKAILAAALLAASIAGCNSEEAAPDSAAAPAPTQDKSAGAAAPEKPLSVTESASVTLTAKVKAIDHATRKVTLEDAQGNSATFTASEAITRLDEVKPGDTVKAEYSVSLLAELRPPTAEEAAAPIAVVSVSGRSPQGDAPAAGAIMATRVVTTVEAIDLPNMRLTLRGPMGDSTTIKAKNPDNMSKLKIGDTIVITYGEGVAISLVKVTG
jgi:ABC-type uncharacterized transport system auxiliary subunit